MQVMAAPVSQLSITVTPEPQLVIIEPAQK
jgi:hypothetical protein